MSAILGLDMKNMYTISDVLYWTMVENICEKIFVHPYYVTAKALLVVLYPRILC